MSTITILSQRIDALGIPIHGVALSPREGIPGTRRVDFKTEATPAQRTLAEAIADGFNTLEIQTNKTTIAADDTDTATLTLQSNQAVDYNIYNSYGGRDFWGALNPSGGVITAPFKTPISGTYRIEILAGNASGYLEIEAI